MRQILIYTIWAAISAATTFGIARSGKICIPPATQKQFQQLKKKKGLMVNPIIIRSPDINNDGIVNFYDFAELAKRWLLPDRPEDWLKER
jgi:hypothetical protein